MEQQPWTACTVEPPAAPARRVRWSDEEVRRVVLTVLSDATGFFPEIIEMDMTLEAELGVDAIARMEILSEVQKQLGVQAQDKAVLCEAKTVGELVGAMLKELTNQSSKSNR